MICGKINSVLFGFFSSVLILTDELEIHLLKFYSIYYIPYYFFLKKS